jgi:hypothetical protein
MDWLKIEKATPRKPEVLVLSEILGIHPDHAFGLCFRFWSWCDDQLSSECHRVTVTSVTVDSVIGHSGFASAMIQVGWLIETSGGIEVPNFDRHLSKSAKSRSRNAENQQLRRKRVAKMSPPAGDKTVTREEKRRYREAASATSTCSEPETVTELTVTEPAEPEPEPVIILPCKGKGPKEYAVSQEEASELAEAYPAVEVMPELLRVRQWLRANPARQKTHRGCSRFLNSWFSRQQDHGYRNQNSGGRQQLTNRQRIEQANADAFDLLEGIAAADHPGPA